MTAVPDDGKRRCYRYWYRDLPPRGEHGAFASNGDGAASSQAPGHPGSAFEGSGHIRDRRVAVIRKRCSRNRVERLRAAFLNGGGKPARVVLDDRHGHFLRRLEGTTDRAGSRDGSPLGNRHSTVPTSSETCGASCCR